MTSNEPDSNLNDDLDSDERDQVSTISNAPTGQYLDIQFASSTNSTDQNEEFHDAPQNIEPLAEDPARREVAIEETPEPVQNQDLDREENSNNDHDDLDIYFVNEDEMDDEEEDDDDDLDYEDEADHEEEFDNDAEMDEDQEVDEEDNYEDEEEESDLRTDSQAEDEYENVANPPQISYDTELPSSHNYLGSRFRDVKKSSRFVDVVESNDVLTLPLLIMPGCGYFENDRSDNSVQLIPGQVMPIYFYSPMQTQVIRKRMNDQNPTVGFVFSIKSLKLSESSETSSSSESAEQHLRLGIIGEILSTTYEASGGRNSDEDDDEENRTDFSALVESTGGIIVKIKGSDRFHIMNVTKDITGCYLGKVRILPEYVLDRNPLTQSPSVRVSASSNRNRLAVYDAYFGITTSRKCNHAQAERLNTFLSHPTWLYRKYDCDYLMHQIRQELTNTFQQEIPFTLDSSKDYYDMNSASSKQSHVLAFCSWLLSNFPFDNQMRLHCLSMNCVNHRLIYMHDLLKKFTNISCRQCGALFCSKSDVFSISKQGFMTAYLNPGGVVHETLTVYKLKNFYLINGTPSQQHSWFPGYAWQICVCRQCNNHIGWKFTKCEEHLKPDKFWGLTRKAIRYTYNKEEEEDLDEDELDELRKKKKSESVSSEMINNSGTNSSVVSRADSVASNDN